MSLIELQSFLNDLVSNSPDVGRAAGAPAPCDNHGSNRHARKSPLDNLEVVATKRFERGEGSGRGRGRGRGNPGGHGRTSSIVGLIPSLEV
jgi:hypothetical protein